MLLTALYTLQYWRWGMWAQPALMENRPTVGWSNLTLLKTQAFITLHVCSNLYVHLWRHFFLIYSIFLRHTRMGFICVFLIYLNWYNAMKINSFEFHVILLETCGDFTGMSLYFSQYFEATIWNSFSYIFVIYKIFGNVFKLLRTTSL